MLDPLSAEVELSSSDSVVDSSASVVDASLVLSSSGSAVVVSSSDVVSSSSVVVTSSSVVVSVVDSAWEGWANLRLKKMVEAPYMLKPPLAKASSYPSLLKLSRLAPKTLEG